jgi:hypothetical protein
VVAGAVPAWLNYALGGDRMLPYIAIDVEQAMRATWGWELREPRPFHWQPEPERDDGDDDEPRRPGGLTVALRALARLAGAARRATPSRARPAPS